MHALQTYLIYFKRLLKIIESLFVCLSYVRTSSKEFNEDKINEFIKKNNWPRGLCSEVEHFGYEIS